MTEQQKDFVHMYLKHRDKIVAHNLAYGNNSNIDSVESSANRLLRIPEIAETIRSIQDNIRHEVEEEFKAKYREELLTIYDKRRILKKIATGEMYIEQKYKGKNCTQCSQYISPTYHMMMQALKEDSKLAGHYPHKQNGKWVIPALQTEEEQEEILSPLGRGWGGSTHDEQETQEENPPEKDNIGQQIDFMQDQEISLPFRGIGGELPQENTPEKDNKRQHPDSYRDETNIDNQPLAINTSPLPCPSQPQVGIGGGVGGKHDTPTIISQEKLRELLYPKHPKLTPMENKLQV